PSYWARFFAAHCYDAFDCIRPLFVSNETIDPWYRFNTLLYANAAGAARLSENAKRHHVDQLADLDRGGDFLWHLRRTLLRSFLEPAVTLLSRLRYRLLVAFTRHGE